MAKVRIPINPLQVGRVGAYSMYVSQGRQIVRQRQNSSNYGESAARSLAQQTRRARWGNLVNVYKALSFWQPKAWENLRPGVTDYNAFMGANINLTPIYLTKDQVANGCAVMDNFTLSKGSLAPIDGAWEAADQAFTTGIRMSASVTAQTTIAQLSADIIALNGGFVNGDNIAYIIFEQSRDERGYPYLRSRYYELTLDVNDVALLSSLPIFPLLKTDNPENLFFAMVSTTGWTGIGAVAIHTRRASSLKVSTQKMVVINTSLIAEFSTDAARVSAIESYGLDTDVPLEPSPSGRTVVLNATTPALPLTSQGDGEEVLFTMNLPRPLAEMGFVEGDEVGYAIVDGMTYPISWLSGRALGQNSWCGAVLSVGGEVSARASSPSENVILLRFIGPENVTSTLQSVAFYAN